MGPGTSSTVTGGGPTFGGAGAGVSDLLRKLIERKLAATAPPPRGAGALAAKTSRVRPQTRGGGGEGGGQGAGALLSRQMQQSADAYDASVRGAAMRPTGLGPAMIPGMGVDVNLLPSRMRPDSAGFVPTTGGRVPTGSIAPAEYGADSLYGYGAANPRAEALGNIRGGIDPISDLVYGGGPVPPRR